MKGEKKVNSNKKSARIVGVLFITATVSAILALVLYQPILSDPDYIIKGPANENQVILGALVSIFAAFRTYSVEGDVVKYID